MPLSSSLLFGRAATGRPSYSLFDYMLGGVVIVAMIALFLLGTIQG